MPSRFYRCRPSRWFWGCPRLRVDEIGRAAPDSAALALGPRTPASETFLPGTCPGAVSTMPPSLRRNLLLSQSAARRSEQTPEWSRRATRKAPELS